MSPIVLSRMSVAPKHAVCDDWAHLDWPCVVMIGRGRAVDAPRSSTELNIHWNRALRRQSEDSMECDVVQLRRPKLERL